MVEFPNICLLQVYPLLIDYQYVHYWVSWYDAVCVRVIYIAGCAKPNQTLLRDARSAKRGIAAVSGLSVCLSATLMHCGHASCVTW